MSRRGMGIGVLLIGAFVPTPLATAQTDEAALGRDLAAAAEAPCWQPVYAEGRRGLPGVMGGPAIVRERCEAPATLRAARELARRHGEEAAPYWARRAGEMSTPPERGLALATLVALADRPGPADRLAGLLFDERMSGNVGVAFSLIVDLHGPSARPLLERLVAEACRRRRANPERPPSLQSFLVLSRAAELLGAVGDEGTRDFLRGLLARGGKADPCALPLRLALDAIDARLSQPEAERAAWGRDAIEFVKARWFHSGSISAEIDACRGAGWLAGRGVRLGVPFLRFPLSGRASADLAVAVAGSQREAALIPDLARVAERQRGGYTSSMAVAALGQVGTREAMDALLAMVRPDFPMRIAGPLSVLARDGDATTLRALVRLATDRSFDAADRADIAAARDYLAARLAGRPAASPMGDGPQFPPR
ncbi:hypothetical protein OJF2_42600 [Aquisphaera giovannonii]|uniref:HEAT repeat protein n=1 Tax=Aquisphaera giovannonii TaxID=406548 RepID=A0A5B9W574_9BACT|nr:hypothetical protein [Aquisphaera giovannonii]QEH35703.1 hypothetical protein OJF2_42600 [Aquisphaera giovannonii]